MRYRHTIVAYVPFMIGAAVATTFFVSLHQAIVGYALGVVAGGAVGCRGVRMLEAHILRRNRTGFRVWRRPIGILVFFILPAVAGIGLGLLYQFRPDIVMTGVLAGSSAVATWWILMGCWIWRIERRTGREVLLLADGFHLTDLHGDGDHTMHR